MQVERDCVAAIPEGVATVAAPSPHRCDLFGIELECWLDRESSDGLVGVAGGSWANDAGKGLGEAITRPCSTVSEAFSILEKMFAEAEAKLSFVTDRPLSLMKNSGQWHSKARYMMILQALSMESKDWKLVHRMTDLAALQVNFSGAMDPFGDDGAFLINMFNDLAPGIAAQIHREIGYGQGHLSLWQKFARVERLPQYGRWFTSGQDLVAYIEAISRLIRELDDGGYLCLPDEKQSIHCQLDLGVVWWFLRAKRGEYGEYLELRHLPSMPLKPAREYAQQAVDMVEVLLDWFHGPNRSQPIVSQAAALPAYQRLHSCFPDYISSSPVSQEEWLRLLEL